MQYKTKKQSLFLKLFPVPNFLSLDPVGIDISLRSVRAMRLKHSKYGLIPDKYKEVVLKEKCELLEKQEDLEHCDELRSSLRELKKELNLKYITLSLPELKTYIFNTTLPFEASESIDDALIVKLQENIPLDLNDIVYDYVVSKINKNKSTMEVVVTVLPKNIIEIYTNLFKEEGLIPVAFESESQSVARAVVAENDKTPYLIVNFGHAKISFAIVEQEVVQYTSSLPYSTETILKDFSCQEAQTLKSTLNKLLIYWFTNKHNPDSEEKITNVIMTGSFADAPGLAIFLEQHLHVSVGIANVWKNCFDINEYVPEMDLKTALQYNTAIGLALMKQ
ncbi:MAG: pilus assembly protein PilM [Candidatus Pacebacteria bacterium]|nr:pilus assembly protein PilM [Candidatus Paceibacterota bacterium]